MREREPQKEPLSKDCGYCKPGTPAAWEIVSDSGNVFVCDFHRYTLIESNAVREERLLFEAEWSAVSGHEEEGVEHEFDDMDQWEDGSLYGY